MGEQGAWNNVHQKMEKKIKKKLKTGKTNEESDTGLLQIEVLGKNEVSEHKLISETEDITEMSRNHRRNKEKKQKKEVEDAELIDMEKDSSRGKKIDVYGEDGSGDAVNSSERNLRRTEKKKSRNEACYLPSSEVGKLEENEALERPLEKNVAKLKSGKEAKKERNKRKLMEVLSEGDVEGEYTDHEQGGTLGDHVEGSVTEKDKRKKRKRERINGKDDNCRESQGDSAVTMKSKSKIYDDLEENTTIENEGKSEKMFEKITEDFNDDFSEKVKRKKKKKAVENEHNEGDLSALPQNKKSASLDGDAVEKHKRMKKRNKTYDKEVEKADNGKSKKAKLVVNDLEDPTPSKSNKKVSFSGQVEVFTLPDDSNTEKIYDKEDLVRGKRFTPEENKILKEAVLRYIDDHDLGEDGLDMVLNCKSHPELRGCWKEIAAALPYRPNSAVYYRAQVIFRRSASRKWTQEEYDMILKYQELHGNQWKALADELGKHRWHVKDCWRRIKLRSMNKGQWSQKEYQNLFDLVNTDLQLKVSEDKKSKHGMLRDNICWTAISDKLTTRAQANCCIKWYNQLTSPMVAEGLWADTDDYRLLQKLYCMDAGCMEDVDWDSLLDHRSGDLCRKRWNQMVRHIGNYGTKPFSEQVDLLAERYCPTLLEAREIWDNKPRVP